MIKLLLMPFIVIGSIWYGFDVTKKHVKGKYDEYRKRRTY